MSQKDLLKQIAYYTRLIEEHERRNESPTYVDPALPPNKFIYVKQGNQRWNTAELISNVKVHVNPNFKCKVHVNPHFKKSESANKNRLIHINPNILKQTAQSVHSNLCVENTVKFANAEKPVLTEMQRGPSLLYENAAKPTHKEETLMLTKTKLIRVSCDKGTFNSGKVPSKNHSRYKIIRRSRTCKTNETVIKNKFKIVNNSCASRPNTSFRRMSLPLILNTRHVIIKKVSKVNKSGYVNINGILYKRSPNALRKTSQTVDKSKKIVKRQLQTGKVLNICGQKYKLDSNHKTLTLLADKNKASFNLSRIHIGGIIFKKKESDTFVKVNAVKNQFILSQAKQRSIQTLTNKMRKCNMPCPFFRKFGRCRGKENGKCNRVHNTDCIALCSKFLQGACSDSQCPLSHRVSPEKMPTCKFFLEGLCSKEDCPYLHVKINARAEICKDFVEGFCKKAEQCDKRHQYLCPDFEKTGTCKKKRCAYPHGDTVSKNKLFKKAAIKLPTAKITAEVSTQSELSSSTVSNSNNLVNENLPACVQSTEDKVSKRYYVDSCALDESLAPQFGESSHSQDSTLDVSSRSTRCNTDGGSPSKKRPQLGDLPSFIPLNDSL